MALGLLDHAYFNSATSGWCLKERDVHIIYRDRITEYIEWK